VSDRLPTYDELLELTRQQARRIAALEAEVARLRAALEEAQRQGKRQAAPFSKGPPQPSPKRPGRKSGHRPAHRPLPPPEQVQRTLYAARPLLCPACDAFLADPPAYHDQYQVDLPPPRPVITRFRIPVCRCRHCGERVQGRHPEQTSDALGAAAVQLGPNLLALAADLKHRLGLSYRKAADLLGVLTGQTVSAGALARSGHRLRRLAQPTYDRLEQAARASPVQHIDETGWRIGGRAAWLWVFADERMTLYRIRPSRGHDVIIETLGEDYGGVVVSDCFLAYDPLAGPKQKCFSHLLKTCGEIEQAKTKGAVRFSRKVGALLRQAMALRRRRGELSPHGYAAARGRIEAAMDRLLAGTYTDPDNARLAKRLRKHRGSLFTFLYRGEVEATNNRAERELRPAVIARKLSAGNRTEAGAETHAVLASILRTCRRQGRAVVQTVADLLRHGPGHVLDLLTPQQAALPTR
jgi:transposase